MLDRASGSFLDGVAAVIRGAFGAEVRPVLMVLDVSAAWDAEREQIEASRLMDLLAGVLPSPAVVSVPVGNGALINGVGSWLRSAAPGCRVVGVQAEGAAAMTLSWRAGRPVDTPSVATYADGIASRIAIPAAVELMTGRVDEMRIVSDEAIRAAQAELTAELGITVEGAAAASWAGLLAGPRPAGPAVVILTGSNV
jgi:threonine dehydratase